MRRGDDFLSADVRDAERVPTPTLMTVPITPAITPRFMALKLEPTTFALRVGRLAEQVFACSEENCMLPDIIHKGRRQVQRYSEILS